MILFLTLVAVVAALSIINEYVSKIDVYPWDTAYLTQVGLSAVNAPDVQYLWTSTWDHRSSRTSELPEWEVIYHIPSATQQTAESDIDAICRAFYDAGASLNYEGDDTIEFADYFWDDGDGEKGFTGYTADYSVEIYNSYRGNTSDPFWSVTITIKKNERD